MAQGDDLTARLRGMRGELDEIFIELWTGPRHRRPPVLAPADVYLTDSPPTLTVQLDLAGVDPADVDIILDGDELTVRGARTRRPGRRVYQHAEIDWGPFRRRLRIGVAVDA